MLVGGGGRREVGVQLPLPARPAHPKAALKPGRENKSKQKEVKRHPKETPGTILETAEYFHQKMDLRSP